MLVIQTVPDITRVGFSLIALRMLLAEELDEKSLHI